ncbi:FAD-dependent oxidoreductase [Desulfovirgula thermocuniculi]|uniref:FAD-dependent oxidoreductase n=1 Tax=Desulfovirgula thermocuniculi TaxID=348842 RepID=UPI0004094CB1|nr:FAD-dependent oxidoreductase [Desulfovirgula thermocuniculi]
MTVRVVVVGGGWAGTGAAVAAAQAGAEVILLERTDMLLGTGLVGGIMRNNGRFTATEEAIAMGLGDIFHVVDLCARHRNVDFPGHRHATLYDVCKIEPAIRNLLLKKGIQVHTQSRVKDVEMEGKTIRAVVLDSGEKIAGDAFVDTTGSAGPMGNCTKYGNGCAMCILRCATFGGRVSIAARAGVKEYAGRRADGAVGAMSGSCKLHKDSLAPEIVAQLNEKGVVVIPVPPHLRKGSDILAKKACQQYALAEFAENIILLDTGHAKLMAPTYPLSLLRQIPGFENARYEDPYAGGVGNSIRYLAISPRDNAMKVDGVENLFCAGEKAGPMVGHTEAIITGALAGHNAVRLALGLELLEIPPSLATGDYISYVNEQVRNNREGLAQKYTFSGSIYFRRMQEKGLYTTDVAAIRDRVEEAGMSNIFGRRLVPGSRAF